MKKRERRNANVKAISQPKAGWKNQRQRLELKLKNNATRWSGRRRAQNEMLK